MKAAERVLPSSLGLGSRGAHHSNGEGGETGPTVNTTGRRRIYFLDMVAEFPEKSV